MRRKLLTSFAAAIVFLLAATSALAHHSMFMYDRDHATTMRGTITEFSWANPHAQLFFNVKQQSGTIEKWMAEMPSPNRLEKNGWSKDMLRPGDQVTIVGNCSKDGGPSMRLMKVILANGQELAAYTF